MEAHNDPFFGAGTENTENIVNAFRSFGPTLEFLTNPDVHIPLFPTEVRSPYDHVRYAYDVDGLVVEVKDLSCLRANLHYLFCSRVHGHNISNQWNLLKKHLPLREYSRDGLVALHRTYGYVIAFIDGGFFLNLSCVPVDKQSPHLIFKSDVACRAQAVSLINQVLDKFQSKLSRLEPEDLQRPTIIKANILNPGKLNVLKQDQRFVLSLFMSAINEVNVNEATRLILTITKFGQKDVSVFELPKLIEIPGVQAMSIHIGCCISGVDPSIDFMWSRVGLQDIVGTRGSLFQTCGMSEAANFQSNIDNLPMDLSDRLNLLFRQQDCTLNFVQLYAESPHTIVSELAKHPVSRVITTCGLHHPKHNTMLLSQAKGYLDQMENMSKKMQCRIKARIEGVYYYHDNFPVFCVPHKFYSEEVLDTMLQGAPLLIPFQDNEFGYGLGEVLFGVTDLLTKRLREIFDESKGFGGYLSSWSAFQYELALEQIFFGKPKCPSSNPYSVSLGVCGVHPDSLSTYRRFIGLAPVGSASVGEDPPPLDTWFKDKIQQQRVRRLFPLTDALLAEPPVLGEHLLVVLLKDLFQKDVGLEFLKGPQLNCGQLVDSRSIQDLSQELAQRKGFGYPHTFGRALQMVTSRGGDVIDCLEAGLSKIKFFPKIVYWDERRHPKAKWNGYDYLELLNPHDEPSLETVIAVFSGDVLANIESRCLSFASNLKKYKEKGMPWMEACLERIPKKLSREKKLHILTYLSCVALLQQNDFVSFDRLVALQSEMNTDLDELKKWQVISNLLLMNRPRVFRLMDNIPYKVTMTSNLGKRQAPQTEKPPETQGEHVEEEELLEIEEEVVVRVPTQIVPPSEGSWWTGLELGFISRDKTVNDKDAYKSYLSFCKQKNVRVRSFEAFRRRRRRVLNQSK